MTSNNIDVPSIITRGRLAIHIAQFYAFDQVTGSNALSASLSRELALFLDVEALPNPYQQQIDEVLIRFVQAAPQLVALLSHPDGLELAAGLLCEGVEQSISEQISESELAQTRAVFGLVCTNLQEALEGTTGDGLSVLGDALDVDIETIANEPERLRQAFPPREIGLGAAEVGKLEESLGFSVDDRGGAQSAANYAQALFPTLLQIANGSANMKLGNLSANSPVWQWAGTKKPTRQNPLSSDDAFDAATTAVANIFAHLAKQEGRQQIARYLLARLLRQEYSLGKGRGHESTPFSGVVGRGDSDPQDSESGVKPEWDPPEPEASQGPEEVDLRMTLDRIRESAPPAQQEAMDLYLESLESGKPLADICRELGKDPNLIRNNFQALKSSVRKKFSQD